MNVINLFKQKFTNEIYTRLFFAQGISQICDRMMAIAVVWLLSTHVKPEWASWFLAFGALPHLLLFKWTPQIINRKGPLNVILQADLIRGVSLIVLSFFFYGEWKDYWIAFFFFVYFFVNFFAAFFNPAIFMIPTSLATDESLKRRLVALIETCFSLSNVIAPIISLLVYKAIGMMGLFLINGASYIISWYIERGLARFSKDHADSDRIQVNQSSNEALRSLQTGAQSFPEPEQQPEKQKIAEQSVGIKDIAKRDLLIVYMLAGFLVLNLLLGPLFVLIPLYASQIFHGDLGTVSTLEFSLALGTLLGGVLLTLKSFGKGNFFKIVLLLVIDTLCFLSFCHSKNVMMGGISLALLGFVLSIANVMILDLFQTRSNTTELSTIMSYVNVIGVATLPLSLSVFGWFLGVNSMLLKEIAVTLALSSFLIVIIFSVLPLFFSKLRLLIKS